MPAASPYVAGRLRRDGWIVETEVEIAGAYGPGWIDVLAFHPASGSLLVIEVKTEIRDLGRTQRTLAWYESHGVAAAGRFGWKVRVTHGALFVLATEAVDRALRDNRGLLAVGFPARATELARYVQQPDHAPAPTGRGIALIDPLSRRTRWLRSTNLEGRRTPAPYLDYADVVRTLDRRPGARPRQARDARVHRARGD